MVPTFQGRPNRVEAARSHSAAVRAIARRQNGRILARTGADGSVTFRQRKRLSGPEKPQPAFALIYFTENHS